MIYYILYEILDINVFKYITFRGFLALLTSFAIVYLISPKIINFLAKLQNKKGGYRRKYTPDTHEAKKNTPTMGGVIILISVLITSLIWCNINNIYVITVLFTFLTFGFIGVIDDYLKIKYKSGLSSRSKFFMQVSTAIVSSSILIINNFDTAIYFPIFKDLSFDLGVIFILWAVFIIVGTSNAVNLTDGLDGLAIGISSIVIATFVVLSYISGHYELANYLHLPYIKDSGELSVFLMALLGAGLGFLWFNSYPAQIFMGDAGSLSIGASIATVALITKQEFTLAIVGAIFVWETISVILQVAYFKATGGKRLFLRAPIHHHYELKGIPETKIVIRKWIITILLAIIALALIKIR
ncbi:MAG TPA: phospho-N-acetylmuramoyl-pentapeptide-transferase [Persephonella sp.]|nr:phospho-N-acetylmuramoyl-pentapeptide-transferase [Hydrogenothermaceae bacterium]HIQ25468.1 phospho-N-acetylmuramoyl-pentapeptide-transferase [Persephonella sp.]